MTFPTGKFPDPENSNLYWTIEEGIIGPGTLITYPDFDARRSGKTNKTFENFSCPGTFAVKRDKEGNEITRILMY